MELEDAHLSLVDGFEPVESRVESEHVFAGGVDPGELAVPGHAGGRQSALEGGRLEGVAGALAPQKCGGDGAEVVIGEPGPGRPELRALLSSID